MLRRLAVLFAFLMGTALFAQSQTYFPVFYSYTTNNPVGSACAMFSPPLQYNGLLYLCDTLSSHTYKLSAGNPGTVTRVAASFTGGLVSIGGSPFTNTGTLAFTVAGTSGGVPYFNSASTWASTGALTANLPVLGGGAGSPLISGGVSGNTTVFGTVLGTLTSGNVGTFDASGNVTASALPVASIVQLNATNTYGSSAVNDASVASHTLPLKSGITASKPATCTVGEEYFATDATAGQNEYYCTSTNVWTQQTGSGGGGSSAWSALTTPSGNLALTMAAYTSTYTFNATTGASDLWKLTDTTGNTGTGILAHYTTASGSTETPWQADANGVGWQVSTSGSLQSVGGSGSTLQTGTAANTDIAGRITLSGGAGAYSFSGTYASSPVCMTVDQTVPANTYTLTVTTSSISISGGTGSDVIKYICVGLN